MRARGLMAAAAATLALAGCGAPETLSREDGRVLASARERLDDAIDTEEAIRTSPEEAGRLRAKVRAIVARGSFEDARADEFALASLGELQQAVPSLVVVDGRGDISGLDRPATRAFLVNAGRNAPAALLPAARRQVDAIVERLKKSGAGPDTKLPRGGSASRFVRAAERDVRGIWPGLGRRLAAARADL